MNISVTINTLGLLLDILGVMIIFFNNFDSTSSDYFQVYLFNDDEESENQRKTRVLKFWSKIGLIAIVLGFVLQLISNYI